MVFMMIFPIKYNPQGQNCQILRAITILMSTKPSELYLYFQNKAHHYQNIQAAKSKVEDRLQEYMNQSIDYISRKKYDRDFPQNKRYDIDVENDHMNQRLASIQTTNRKEILINGNYSRYNSFERKFRSKNKALHQMERQREIKNLKIQAKIKTMKPQIGTHKSWQEDYKEKTKMRREVKPSKGQILLERKSFMAEPYVEFINQINGNQNPKSPKAITSSRSSKGQEKIAIQKLFVLPNLTTKKSTNIKNSQATIIRDNSEPNIDKKEQNVVTK